MAVQLETDRLYRIGVYQTDVDRHLQPVLEQARTSRDSEEFFRKISTPGFSHKKQSMLISSKTSS